MAESTKKIILLAEDDHSMRRFIEITLQQAGYEVLAVEDGLEATKTALENHVDAVIADAIMPNMTGYDLCRMLRAHPEKSHVPLIILSGLDPVDPDKPAEPLADIFLTKGTSLKENLLSGLKELL